MSSEEQTPRPTIDQRSPTPTLFLAACHFRSHSLIPHPLLVFNPGLHLFPPSFRHTLPDIQRHCDTSLPFTHIARRHEVDNLAHVRRRRPVCIGTRSRHIAQPTCWNVVNEVEQSIHRHGTVAFVPKHHVASTDVEQGFYNAGQDELIEPALTGFSYSFTADGFYEEAYYRAISNRTFSTFRYLRMRSQD